jgi:hypothetical protein
VDGDQVQIRFGHLDSGLFLQFSPQRQSARLIAFDATAREMPARRVGVSQQKHAAFVIYDNAANPEGGRPSHAPEGLEGPVAERTFPQGIPAFPGCDAVA